MSNTILEKEWNVIGENMKNERIEFGATQQKVANLIGCSEKTLRRFEQGKNIKSSMEVYRKYKQVLNQLSNDQPNEPDVKIDSYNLYEQARNKLLKLLPNHLQERFNDFSFIAGGCIYSIYNKQEPNDYDFFLTDKKYAQTLRDYFNDLDGLEEKNGIKKGEYKGLPFIITDNAISIDKYQIITQWVGSIEEVVAEFDFKHNQFFYYKGEVGTLSSFKYLDDNKLYYNEERGRNIAHTFIRTIKFVERGWTISQKELSKMLLKLNEVGLSEKETESFNSVINRDSELDTYSNKDENYSEE